MYVGHTPAKPVTRKHDRNMVCHSPGSIQPRELSPQWGPAHWLLRPPTGPRDVAAQLRTRSCSRHSGGLPGTNPRDAEQSFRLWGSLHCGGEESRFKSRIPHIRVGSITAEASAAGEAAAARAEAGRAWGVGGTQPICADQKAISELRPEEWAGGRGKGGQARLLSMEGKQGAESPSPLPPAERPGQPKP